MVDEKFIIEIVLRARDEMGRVLAKTRGELSEFDKTAETVASRMDTFNRASQKMRAELDKVTAQAEKTRRGIRSIGGEDIKIKADIDDRPLQHQLANIRKSLETTTARVEALKLKHRELNEEIKDHPTPGWTRQAREIKLVEDAIADAQSRQQGWARQLGNMTVKIQGVDDTRRQLAALDKDLDRTIQKQQRAGRFGPAAEINSAEIARIRREMEALGATNLGDRIRVFEDRARAFGATATQAFNRTTVAAQRSGRAVRGVERDFGATTNKLIQFNQWTHRNRESIAKFDNEIRGLRLLVIIAQLDAIISAAIGLVAQLGALASSAAVAGAALGGALAAGAAQAVPAIGLLAAGIARLKAVFDVVGQIDKAQQAEATRGTSAMNTQADSADRLATAHDSVRNALERVSEARREARRDLIDLMLAERQSRLDQEQSEDRVRQLRSQGVTGFELAAAKLDEQESTITANRASQDANRARAQGVDRAPSVVDAQRALQSARRGLVSARRDIAEGGAAEVAAARQLQFLEGQLTNSERRLVKSIQSIKETWREVSRPITDTIVEAFDRGVQGAEKVLRNPELGKAFQELADSGARQMDRFTSFTTNPQTVDFFTRQTREMAKNMEPAATATIRMSRAFMNIADAAAPTLHRLLEEFARFTGRIERSTEDRSRLEEIFEAGERHLHAWLRLAGAIGQTVKAIVAPGGDLASGAAASGLRTINRLTERFRDAAEWINGHPLEVNEFFGDSEQVFERLLDLLIEIGRVMLNAFDPESVDALADLIEVILPAFASAVDVMAQFTRIFVDFISIPNVKEAFQLAFGFLLFTRIGGRIQTLLLSFVGPISKAAVGAGQLRAAIAALPGGITAAAAAWRGYGIAQATAMRAGAAAGVAGGAFIGPGGPQAPAGQVPGGFIPVPGARTGPQAPASRYQRVRSTIRQTGRSLGRGITGGIGAVGRLALPLAGITGVLGAIGAGSGEFGNVSAAERLQQGVSTATFGLLPGLKSTDDRVKEIIKNADKLKRVIGMDEVTPSWDDFTDAQRKTIRNYIELHNSVQRLNGPLRQLRNNMRDVADPEALDAFRKNFVKLREYGVTSLDDLRKNFKFNTENINKGLVTGSKGWQEAMVVNFRQGIDGVRDLMKRGVISTDDGMREIRRITRVQGRFMRDNLTTMSDEARTNMALSFASARKAAEKEFGGITEATGRGLRIVRSLLKQELKAFGLSEESIKFRLEGKEQSGKTIGAPLVNKAVGGFIGQPGEREGDTQAIKVGGGEAVLNWAHQKVVEPALNAYYGSGLSDMFRRVRGWHGGKAGGGFARGGMVAYPYGSKKQIIGTPYGGTHTLGNWQSDNALDISAAVGEQVRAVISGTVGRISGGWSGGTSRFDGYQVYLQGNNDQWWYTHLKRALARTGQKVAAGNVIGISGAANGVPHLHIAREPPASPQELTSYPIEGGKIARGGKGGAGAIAALRAYTRQANIKQIGVGGSDKSVPRAILERGLNVIGKLGEDRINKAAQGDAGGPSGSAGAAPPGQLRSWLRRALEFTRLYTPANLNALYGRAMQESGGNPRAINLWDSNAAAGIPSKGLLQTIDPTFDAYKAKGHGNIWNPVDNAIAAIRYMMSRYGHIVGPSGSGYAMGGMIPGPDGMPKNILAHAGEWVLNKVQQSKVAQMAGTTADKVRDRLGFTGGPGSFQGGGLIVGDSLGVGTADFLKGFKRNVEVGRRADEALSILREMLKNNPKSRNVVFDAGTNDTDPEALRRILNQVVRAVGNRNLLIPTVGGQNAAAKNEVIRSFSDQATILPWRQMAREGNLLTDGVHANSKGYQQRANAIKEAFKGGGSSAGGTGSGSVFGLPDVLPPDFKGFADLVGDFFKHLKTLTKKGDNNFKAVNKNLDLLTRPDGLLDTMGSALENQITNMQSAALRAQFAVRRGIVRQRFGDVGAGERGLNILQFQGARLGRMRRIIGRGLGVTQGQINRIRRGGVEGDEEDQLNDFLTQRRSLRLRRAELRGSIAENLQGRFEAQGGLIESRLGRAIRAPLRRIAASQAAQRISQAFGRGGDVNFIDQEIKAYADQRPAIRRALQSARRQKNTQLADQLSDQLRDLDGQIAELTASRLQAQIDEIEKSFARKSAFIEFKDRFAQATGTLGLDRVIPGSGGSRRGAFQERGALLAQQIQNVRMLQLIAVQQGNLTALDSLTGTLFDLRVQLQENTRALFLARVEEVNRVTGAATGLANTRGRIAELRAELGLITGPESQALQKQQMQAAGAALLAQGGALAALLGEATALGDEEQIMNLTQAVADNELAQLENTKALKELDGSLNETQSFSSTAWEWFRTAIFNGSGGLLPQYNMGTSIGGSLNTSLMGGITTGVNGIGGGIPAVNLEINEAGQVPDPTYFGNRIAFAIGTSGT